jgi:hypothetical protein
MKNLLLLTLGLAALAGCGKNSPMDPSAGMAAANTGGSTSETSDGARGATGSTRSTLTLDERIIRALNHLFAADPTVNLVNLGAAACTQGCTGSSYKIAARQYQKVNGSFQLVQSTSQGDLLPATSSTITFTGGAFTAKASARSVPTLLGVYTLAVMPGASTPVAFAAAGYGPQGYGYCTYPGACYLY